jgi:hypothetical protein
MPYDIGFKAVVSRSGEKPALFDAVMAWRHILEERCDFMCLGK